MSQRRLGGDCRKKPRLERREDRLQRRTILVEMSPGNGEERRRSSASGRRGGSERKQEPSAKRQVVYYRGPALFSSFLDGEDAAGDDSPWESSHLRHHRSTLRTSGNRLFIEGHTRAIVANCRLCQANYPPLFSPRISLHPAARRQNGRFSHLRPTMLDKRTRFFFLSFDQSTICTVIIGLVEK